MNEKKPSWICPVCDKKAAYESLIIDGRVQLRVLARPLQDIGAGTFWGSERFGSVKFAAYLRGFFFFLQVVLGDSEWLFR